MSIESLHRTLLEKKIITNADIGPLTRLVKFLSCYGIFNVEHGHIAHTTLSHTLLDNNVISKFSGFNDDEWRNQGDLMNYLSKLPASASLLTGLTNAAISLDDKAYRLSINAQPADVMVELANIQLLSRAIFTAARLNLMDLVQHGVNSVSALAAVTQQNPLAMERLVNLLAKYKLLNHSRDNTVSLTTASVPLMDGDHAVSIKGAAGMANNHWWNSIGYLRHCIETGNVPYIAVNNIKVFDYLESNKDERVKFDKGLANSDAEQDSLVAQADFGIQGGMSIVDIGGGNGGLITGLVNRNPQIKEAILFDQPQTIDHLQAKIASQQTAADEHTEALSRCVLQPGNFLVGADANGIPRNKDLYIIKGVLHDFTDDDVVTILRNLANAMSSNSVLKIVERYLVDDNLPHLNKIGDMQMMAFFAAKERTLEDYQRLAKLAGLNLDINSAQACGNYSIISAKPSLQLKLDSVKLGESKSILLASPRQNESVVNKENTVTAQQILSQRM